MASIAQVEAGIAKYIDVELAPKIPTNIPNGQVKKIAAVAGAVYAIRKKLRQAVGDPMLAAIGAVGSDGDIDAEGLAEVIREQMPADGLKVTVPILGDLTFFAEDIDRAVEYIEEA